jgi:hypothetical protein
MECNEDVLPYFYYKSGLGPSFSKEAVAVSVRDGESSIVWNRETTIEVQSIGEEGELKTVYEERIFGRIVSIKKMFNCKHQHSKHSNHSVCSLVALKDSGTLSFFHLVSSKNSVRLQTLQSHSLYESTLNRRSNILLRTLQLPSQAEEGVLVVASLEDEFSVYNVLSRKNKESVCIPYIKEDQKVQLYRIHNISL